MGSGCDQVSVLKGRGDSSSCHQAADVSHVCQQVGVELNAQLQDTKSVCCHLSSLENTSPRTEFPACLLHALVVDEAGVGAGSCDDESGPEEPGRLLQLLVVYQARLRLSDGEGQMTGRGGREERRKGERSAVGIVLLNVISSCSKRHDSRPACKASTQSRWKWLRSSWCPSCSRG